MRQDLRTALRLLLVAVCALTFALDGTIEEAVARPARTPMEPEEPDGKPPTPDPTTAPAQPPATAVAAVATPSPTPAPTATPVPAPIAPATPAQTVEPQPTSVQRAAQSSEEGGIPSGVVLVLLLVVAGLGAVLTLRRKLRNDRPASPVPAAPAPSVAPQKPAEKTCPRCGRLVSAGFLFCDGCGVRLED